MPQNQILQIAGATIEVLVSSRETTGRYTVCRIEYPGPDGPPLHTHSYEDGYFYVIDGSFRFDWENESVEVAAGGSVYVPPGKAYGWKNVGPGVGRMVVVAHPGGLDLLFQDLAAAARGREQLGWKVLQPILEKHGIALAGGLLTSDSIL